MDKERNAEMKYEHEWITLRGRTILCEALMRTLGMSAAILMQKAGANCRDGREFIRDAIYDYMNGREEVGYTETFYRSHHFSPPSSRKLPDAIEEMFQMLEEMSGINLTPLLDEAQEETARVVAEREEEQKRHASLCAAASQLMQDTPFPESPQEKVTYLLQLQAAKEVSCAYDISDEERKMEQIVAEIWCDILIHRMAKETLSYTLMKSLVQQEFVDEFFFTDVLRSLGDERDFEWYDEDFMGSDLFDDTIIPIDSVLQEVEPEFMQRLHIRRN